MRKVGHEQAQELSPMLQSYRELLRRSNGTDVLEATGIVRVKEGA